MLAVDKHLSNRKGHYYFRMRIPADLVGSWGTKTELTFSLKTRDHAVATGLAAAREAELQAEFARMRADLASVQAAKLRKGPTLMLSEAVIADLAARFLHETVLKDERRRDKGLDDCEVEILGRELTDRQNTLRKLVAAGRFDAMRSEVHRFLQANDIRLSHQSLHHETALHKAMLRAASKAVEICLERQAGNFVVTEEVAPEPLPTASWDEVIGAWQALGRSGNTEHTALSWIRQFMAFAAGQGCFFPGHVSKQMVLDFMDAKANEVKVKTVNSRATHLRTLFETAHRQGLIGANPMVEIKNLPVPRDESSGRRRVPFSGEELTTFFGGAVHTMGARSTGQSGEALYWLPLLMLHAGLRPEEAARLTVDSVQCYRPGQMFLRVTEVPEELVDGHFRAVGDPKDSERYLKTRDSQRSVPITQQLIDCGFLRYVEHVKSLGKERLFYTLKQDCKGSYSGSVGKCLGRYKGTMLGASACVDLYSLRHNFKQALVTANLGTRETRRLLGHSLGDGQITDLYGGDLHLDVLFGAMSKVEFKALPVKPWYPGQKTRSLRGL